MKYSIALLWTVIVTQVIHWLLNCGM